MLLSLKNISVHYGKAEAIQGVTMEVAEHSITGIIGANGAGKSTILKVISGLVPISSGEIWLQDRRIDGLPGHKIVELGVVHVPERRRLFPYMSVIQNIKIGAYLRKDGAGIKADVEKVFHRFPILYERRSQRAETLSGGEQQQLAIGRALMAKPKLLILDEPSLGLAPLVVENLTSAIKEIHQEGIGILLVEQNAGLAFDLTDFLYVLEVGRLTLEGKTQDLIDNEMVREAFLGG
jgi:branched-chain amino acid transport system ATP-binding protein